MSVDFDSAALQTQHDEEEYDQEDYAREQEVRLPLSLKCIRICGRRTLKVHICAVVLKFWLWYTAAVGLKWATKNPNISEGGFYTPTVCLAFNPSYYWLKWKASQVCHTETGPAPSGPSSFHLV